MSRQEWVAFGVAAAIHVVGVPVAYTMAPEPPPLDNFVRKLQPYEVDVDVDTAFDVKRARDFRMTGDMPLGMRDSNLPHNPNYNPNLPPTMTRYGRGRVPTNPEDGVLTAPDGASTNNDTFNPDGDWSNAPGAGAPWGTPGIGDVPIWALPGAPGFADGGDGPGAPRTTKKRRYDPDAPSRAVSDAVREKDKKLGLDFPGRGPIRSAFVSATYSSDAPYTCRAAFAVAVNPKGKVTAVNYVSHTGGTTATWEGVGKSAFAQLKSSKLVMKSAFKKGATVSVVVISKKRTPGGGTSRDGATINFDVADVGAKATRIVTAGVSPIPVK